MKALQRLLPTFVVEQPLAYRETDAFAFSLPSMKVVPQPVAPGGHKISLRLESQSSQPAEERHW